MWRLCFKLLIWIFGRSSEMSVIYEKANFVWFIHIQTQKSEIQICSNKRETCLVNAQQTSAFVFATKIEQSFYFLNPLAQTSNHILCLFVCFDAFRPCQQFFSHFGAASPGLTSTKQWGWSVLLKYTTPCPGWGSNTRPCDQESDALPTEL